MIEVNLAPFSCTMISLDNVPLGLGLNQLLMASYSAQLHTNVTVEMSTAKMSWSFFFCRGYSLLKIFWNWRQRVSLYSLFMGALPDSDST